ncbi:MAG: 30S ribosomal protein S17e [Candidatus Altiarchaeales archaeon]|nr:30S ribosomal protein S17e [Candidatus Altiarchaeales archaeon]MBD3415622.1 30S ribosomal protein S17e [Candidatus Altiarchaeales archaeon]
MGRIKQTYLKRVAEKLLREYPDVFTADFQDNKRKVASHTDITSKSIRNKIAGYITRVVKHKKD